jgi:hypothetical protein
VGFCHKVLKVFPWRQGMFSSFEITPNPENIVLRLLMSVWLIAPMVGAIIKYIVMKVKPPAVSSIQSAHFMRFIIMNAAVAATDDDVSIFMDDLMSALALYVFHIQRSPKHSAGYSSNDACYY